MSGRAHVLSLYRAFLREARMLPTEVRRDYVRNKARHEFRASMAAADPQKVEFLVQFGELQLENLSLQRKLLNQLHDEGKLKC